MEHDSTNHKAATHTEFDDVIKPKNVPAKSNVTDDVDLEAWLNEGTTATTSASATSSARQDSWSEWEEVGWEGADVSKTNNDVAVTSSKID